MVYIYDILLNFTNGKLYDFFEWNKTDKLEHVKKIPLFRVEKGIINKFCYYEIKVDQSFMSKLYNMTDVYTSRSINKIPYACLLCDGLNAIAIKIDKDGIVKYRSKLLLDEEDEILCICQKLNVTNLNCSEIRKIYTENFLTRKETKIKNYLLKELQSIYKNKKYEELKYLYTEYYNLKSDDIEFIYKSLIDNITNETNPKQNELYDLLQLIGNKN
ncbi:MAG: hypothetical protein PUD59_01435 [bacterium]|nr:hypothetical protein [bacterium]